MNLPLKHTDSIFIDGEWIKPKNEPDPVFNPATEAVIGLAPVGGKVDVEAAIVSAREAFDRGGWPTMSPKERGAILQRMFDTLMARKADIMRLIVEEAGGRVTDLTGNDYSPYQKKLLATNGLIHAELLDAIIRA